MTLDEARVNVGRSVIYRPAGQGRVPEDGVITAVGSAYVFVLYRGDTHSKATAPGMLEFTHG